MKTFLAIIATAILTWIIASFVHGAGVGVERLWLRSAVKSPGRMALDEIQTDMTAERYKLAKAKIDLLAGTWHRFDSEPDLFRGSGVGDIMVIFSKLGTNITTSKIQP
jgi:hypothetical protein